jgi:hypothetical protein
VKHSFRRGCLRAIINVFGGGNSVADGLKLLGQMRLVDAMGKRRWIAEQQALIFMQL